MDVETDRGPLLIGRARDFADRVAVVDERAEHTFAELLAVSERRGVALLGGRADLDGERIAYLMPPGFDHVTTQWAIWRGGGVAVPLAASHPAPELARLIDDARPSMLVADESLLEVAKRAASTVAAEWGAGGAVGAGQAATDGAVDAASDEGRDVDVITPSRLDERVTCGPGKLPLIDPARPALMIYTSGTTGRPKGVVTTHANVRAQITALVDAWEWTAEDRILHVLPLQHVHGIVNAMSCALWSGACCEFGPPDADGVWERFTEGGVTLFMAVPTIYGRLIAAWEGESPERQRQWSAAASTLRLMVSGSAALPIETLERWQEITGHRLLERYGMTEIGMALGNPLHGERRPGTVGQPFVGVEVRGVDEEGTPVAHGEQGEIEVRGEQVFKEYWERPEETQAAFTADGWFRTGDEAVRDGGYWRIVGRQGVDIIKTGGYKVSALEIEALMRQHPRVAEVAVVGVADDEWGERVCAAVVVASEGEVVGAREGAVVAAGRSTEGVLPAPHRLSPEDLRAWCKERMAKYKVPRTVVIRPELPRNTMGKVLKPEMREVFTDSAPEEGR